MSDPATVNVVVTVAVAGKVKHQATADTEDQNATVRKLLAQAAEHFADPAPKKTELN